jgi:methionyl-tRNA synthetase
MHGQFDRILVTAALPYANGKIHLGHLAGAYLPADIYVRYQRSMKRDVLFVCGSDEHGVPITISAEQEKTTPQSIVDRYHELNRRAFEAFGMSFDNYSRTSIPLHHTTAQEFFVVLHAAGLLHEKTEAQLFDEQAGMFLPDRYVEGTCPVCKNPDARGDQCERCGTFLNPTELLDPRSKISGKRPVLRETVHWYFPLGDFQEALEAYVNAANERDGWKENVLQYCRSWFKDGLQDRAVTRDLQWGVPVPIPGFEDKVLYVWFEAVLGYVSATKEWALKHNAPDKWKEYWLDRRTKYVAFIGKDNVVFHCIVFPAMLMAWNKVSHEQYLLPANVPANEFLNFEGQKFSKSRAWGIDVDEFLERFPADTLRYTLALNLPEYRDADFYWKDFQARTNNELADILGNFINRTMTFAHRNFGGTVPPSGPPSTLDEELLSVIKSTRDTAGNLIEHYRFRDAVLEIMNLARFANKYFNDNEPWKTLKSNHVRCASTIHFCLQAVRSLAILLEPIIPFTSARIWTMLRLAGTPSGDGWLSASEPRLSSNHPLGEPAILFTKVEDEIIQQQVQKLPTVNTEQPSTVTIEDFRRLDLRVARVIAAERVPKSEKLLKLRVSLGTEERQVLAGIAQHYQPESLVGKKVVLVANLAPAKLMGLESQGMVLAASGEHGELALLEVGENVEEGSIVK